MCGICGFIDPGLSLDPDRYPALIQTMSATLTHRGPDASGQWVDSSAGVALGHRRLAVIDTSEHGRQPMRSRNGRCVISYNGEIYNFRTIRAELTRLGCAFVGGSDTEVLAEAIAEWGLEATLRRLNGIFAFALWELDAQRLTLVRDPLGVKPLYWGLIGGRLFFGSELKALLAFPGWQPEIDRRAAGDFLRYGYVPAPQSIYRGVRKLPPGCCMVWERSAGTREWRYWDLGQVAIAGAADPIDSNPSAAVGMLHGLLSSAVGAQMLADVPLGAFLSGGVDSSTVVALMQEQSARPVNTFTIGFTAADFDEAGAARSVARHLGTDHHELYVSSQDLLDLVPQLSRIYDEPFADASQLPTLMVAQLARQTVTVALSGDGGDELFAGYNRHLWAERWWPRLRGLPHPLRLLTARLLAAPKPSFWYRTGRLLPRGLRLPQLASKIGKLSNTLSAADLASAYRHLISHWEDPDALISRADDMLRNPSPPSTLEHGLASDLARMQLADALGYLPDGILTKLDRASMAYGLEARVPLLDPRIVAFAWRVPDALKIRDRSSKWLLRQVLYRYVPASLIERPKMGFSVPLDDWLRGPLRGWADSLLNPKSIAEHGLLRPAQISTLWDRHLAGKTDAGQRLWNLLVLQAWLQR
ncbi:MAG: asparagine synthase (glutamine-hydrolyzing) [Thiohalocapsa sp.]